jgi:hypothetical protein
MMPDAGMHDVISVGMRTIVSLQHQIGVLHQAAVLVQRPVYTYVPHVMKIHTCWGASSVHLGHAGGKHYVVHTAASSLTHSLRGGSIVALALRSQSNTLWCEQRTHALTGRCTPAEAPCTAHGFQQQAPLSVQFKAHRQLDVASTCRSNSSPCQQFQRA